MTYMSTTRRNLYRAARLLGDVEAAQKGRLGQRLTNRLTGRLAGRVLSRLWR